MSKGKGKRNIRPSNAMERGEFIKQLEEAIRKGEQAMHEAAMAHDEQRLKSSSEGWRIANETWLQAAQGMSPEKARAIMVGHAMGGAFAKWMEERRPGPPPSMLDIYGPYDPNSNK